LSVIRDLKEQTEFASALPALEAISKKFGVRSAECGIRIARRAAEKKRGEGIPL
jgi:hypothetical protein